MNTQLQSRGQPRRARITLALGLLLALAAPAVWAADDPCRNPDGTLSGDPNTDQGTEVGTVGNATDDDATTCDPTAIAIGNNVNASAPWSIAIGNGFDIDGSGVIEPDEMTAALHPQRRHRQPGTRHLPERSVACGGPQCAGVRRTVQRGGRECAGHA